jgi:hypothetical protein
MNTFGEFNPIDTLAIAKRLETSGMPKQAAEEMAEVLRERDDIASRTLATKNDLKREIRELELRMVIKIGIILATMITISTSILGMLIIK